MKLRVWNDKYYIHSCPNEGLADVSEYSLKNGYYCCSSFCSFKIPSIFITPPLPKCQRCSSVINIYGHHVIATVIKDIKTYEF